ncbi:MAG: class I SAM-dependent methyltransferase [Thermoplasmata archaeon]
MDPVRKTVETYDRIAEDYCGHTLREGFRVVERRFLNKFLNYIDHPNPKIVDIGCGDGRDSMYLLKQDAEVFSVDMSKGMLDIVEKNVHGSQPVKSDVRRLPFSSRTFHGVWCSGMLYHLPKEELEKALDEIHRLLCKKGIFSFNFKEGEGEGMEEEPRSYGGHPRYFAYYTFKEMREKLTHFRVRKKEYYPMDVFGDKIIHLWVEKE